MSSSSNMDRGHYAPMGCARSMTMGRLAQRLQVPRHNLVSDCAQGLGSRGRSARIAARYSLAGWSTCPKATSLCTACMQHAPPSLTEQSRWKVAYAAGLDAPQELYPISRSMFGAQDAQKPRPTCHEDNAGSRGSAARLESIDFAPRHTFR